MKEENRVKTWVKNHKKEIIIGVVVVAVIAGGTIIYIKSKNGNKIIAKVNSNKPKNDTLKAPNIDSNNNKSEIVSKIPVKKDIAVEKEIVEDVCIQEPIRLTKNKRKEILLLNDGFKTQSYYNNRNSETTWKYKIKDGMLYVNKSGKTSWADSHYNYDYVADDEETRRFLRKNLWILNTNISKQS